MVIAVLLALACTPAESTIQTTPTTSSRDRSEVPPTAIATIPSQPSPTASVLQSETVQNQSVKSGDDKLTEPIYRVSITDVGPFHYGLTSIEERVLHSDVVVRAKLKAINGTARINCRETPPQNSNIESFWNSNIEYEFRPLAVLKGQAQASYFVEEPLDYSFQDEYEYDLYESESDAVANAEYDIKMRKDHWDEREAILFLKEIRSNKSGCNWRLSEESQSYGFALAGSLGEYRLESPYNRAWLPATDGSLSSPKEQFLLSKPADEEKPTEHETEHVDKIRLTIARHEKAIEVATAKGIAGYEECLGAMYSIERFNQATIARGGEFASHWDIYRVPRLPLHLSVGSHAVAGENLAGNWMTDRHQEEVIDGYEMKFWLSGPDAHHFDVFTTKDVRGSGTWVEYDIEVKAGEIIPPGDYEFTFHQQESIFQPCDYNDEASEVKWIVSIYDSKAVTNEYSFLPVDVRRIRVGIRCWLRWRVDAKPGQRRCGR